MLKKINIFSPLPQYKNLNLIYINKKNLTGNFSFFQNFNPNTKVCPVLKSNAYGHGLVLVGKFVDKEIHPEFICVDSLYEAYELRKNGVNGNILILGYTFPNNFNNFCPNLSVPLYDFDTLIFLKNNHPKINIHLKIDTGLNRLGIKENQIESFAKKLKKCRNINVQGIYSHLANADKENEQFSIKQINLFKKIVNYFEKAGFEFKYKHINATAGSIKFPDPFFNMSRIGLGFYGLSPFSQKSKFDKLLVKNLKPSLKLISHVVELKTIKKGETVSYGQTYRAKAVTKIGIIPLGYYEGLDRRFSNNGVVVVKNTHCRVLGRVCMNLTAIDLTNVNNAEIGNEVIVFNDNPNAINSVSKCAEKIDTIPYEILTGINPTIKRLSISS